MLPACGHTLCAACIANLPTQRVRGSREAKCPLCRVAFTPGSAVPNWSLREAAEATSGGAPPPPAAPRSPPAGLDACERRSASPSSLAALGIPPGLARIARDEAERVGVRVFLLDNSGSTNTYDGHELRGHRLVSCTRWREICASAEAACAFGAAVGVPCEFHLLNPLRPNRRSEVEGEDFIRTEGAGDDARRLRTFLGKVNPTGVTPLAERLQSLWPRFDAFAESAGASGRIAFLVIATDGAPTPPNSGQPTPRAASAALAMLRRLTQAFPVRLVVRLCTDESDAVGFWNDADAEVELPLDVLDDIEGEAKEIASVGNGWLAYSPALHTLRESGTTCGLLDLLDERRLAPGEAAVLAGLLLDGGEHPLPDWRHEPAEFAAELRQRAAAAGTAFDARRRRVGPIIDVHALLRAQRRRGALLAQCGYALVGVLGALLAVGAVAAALGED